MPVTRRALAVPATLACLALTQVAAADTDPPTKEACVEAHASGQLLRHEGKWLKARKQFLTCVADSCPAVLRRECSPWLLDLEARTPTLLVVAKDENGQTLRDATVTIDGDAAAATIAITSVPVDPGEHVIRITPSFAPALEKRIVLRDGERNARLDVVIPSPARAAQSAAMDRSSEPPTARRASLVPPLVASGFAVLGLGVFTTFALVGKSQESARAASCGPRCSDQQLRPVEQSYLIADIGLAVGVVATATAAVLFLTGNGGSSAR